MTSEDHLPYHERTQLFELPNGSKNPVLPKGDGTGIVFMKRQQSSTAQNNSQAGKDGQVTDTDYILVALRDLSKSFPTSGITKTLDDPSVCLVSKRKGLEPRSFAQLCKAGSISLKGGVDAKTGGARDKTVSELDRKQSDKFVHLKQNTGSSWTYLVSLTAPDGSVVEHPLGHVLLGNPKDSLGKVKGFVTHRDNNVTNFTRENLFMGHPVCHTKWGSVAYETANAPIAEHRPVVVHTDEAILLKAENDTLKGRVEAMEAGLAALREELGSS